MALGDFNCDLLSPIKCKILTGIMEIFDLKNLVKTATCFMKNCKPSLLDVILTNSSSAFIKTLNFPTGVIDCHNLISSVINCKMPRFEKQKINIRSFRNFNCEILTMIYKISISQVISYMIHIK